MIEIHAAVMGLFVFCFVAMAACCAVVSACNSVLVTESRFWREEYESLNAKLRPSFSDAAENLVPMADSAHGRLNKLKQALRTEGDLDESE